MSSSSTSCVYRGWQLRFTPTDEEKLVIDLFLGLGSTRNSKTNPDGKTFTSKELLTMSLEDFDKYHRFIQCMFPTNKSTAHHDQPFVLTKNLAEFLFQNESCKAWIIVFLKRFFGSIYVNVEVEPCADSLRNVEPTLSVIRSKDHKHVKILEGHSKQRLTRVLTFMSLMGMAAYLQVVKDYIMQSLVNHSSLSDSIPHWLSAAEGDCFVSFV